MPNARKNTSGAADATSRLIIKNLVEMGAFAENGHIVQPVLRNWYEDHVLGRRWRFCPETMCREEHYLKNTRHCVDALEDRGRMPKRGPDLKHQSPRRWNDVKPYTRNYMMLPTVKHDGTPHRKFTFYIGDQLITKSIEAGLPLAGHLNKRIVRNLKNVLGDIEFGLWFHLEPTPVKEIRRPSFHAHGLIYIEDELYFMRRSRKYISVIKALWAATGLDETMMTRQNWLDLQEADLNSGWIRYSTESRNNRRYPMPYEVCPESVGSPLSAMTHTFRRKTRNFYERVLPLMRAIAADRFEEFSAEDWELINKDYPAPAFPSLTV